MPRVSTRGYRERGKPLKRLLPEARMTTGLKPGVNEMPCSTGQIVAVIGDHGCRGQRPRLQL